MWGTRRVPDFGFPKSFLALFMLILGKDSVTLGTAVSAWGEASYSRDTARLSTDSPKSTKVESDLSIRLRTGVPKALRPSTHLAPGTRRTRLTLDFLAGQLQVTPFPFPEAGRLSLFRPRPLSEPLPSPRPCPPYEGLWTRPTEHKID